jgi:HD-GYP domain-containing protein (c-di-GMP phosphodiesterase class II)
MIRKILLQNRTFFFIILIFIIFFGLVLYFGAKRIYDRESKLWDETGSGLLLTGRAVIESIFYNFDHQLMFFHDIPSIKGYVNSNFTSLNYRNEVQNIIYNFAKTTKEIYQIRIIDSSGQETVKIINTRDGATAIVPFSDLQNKKNRYYFKKIMNINNKIYFSSIDLNVESGMVEKPFVPVVRIATPLNDDKGDRTGILILTVNFSKILQLLPKKMFVQTPEGNLIALNPDGTAVFKRSNYNFKDHKGLLKISSTENIHYSTLEFSEDKKLIVALHHNHIELKAGLHKLVFLSAISLAVFLCLIWGISYINISRFQEKNRTQSALISSLVELTDWRDHETGNHLMRTKNYSKALAKQLSKSKKYRKIITDKFIKNIFDTAPLHDIGKVGVKDSILLKAGKFTDEEFEEMKKHVLIGRQVIQDVIDKFDIKESFIITARNITAFHHEKYNGKGYPEGLKGEAIPLEARIFALSDVYDALRSKRPYKDEMTHSEVVRIICSEIGEHFDPDVIDAFLMIGDKFVEISEIYRAQSSPFTEG